jgi:hypothetical protein
MYSCTNAIFQYLKDSDLEKLLTDLYRIEDIARKAISEHGELWFKFGLDDTLATTIENIKTDLKLPDTHPNKKLLIGQFHLVTGIDPDDELQVFYS